jgi:hypothetical protein
MKTIVSLTSIVGNLGTLQPTLLSLLHQSHPPDEIRVYLSEEPYLKDSGFKDRVIPSWLSLLPVRIYWTENTGPYRKLLPVLKECWAEDVAIITVDDDTEYDSKLVETLVYAYASFKCVVACRCFYMGNPLTAIYSGNARANPRDVGNFHTGKGAVLYHPSLFHGTAIVSSREYFRLCPTNDDLWFNLWRMWNKVPCVFIGNYYNFMRADLTNPATALWHNFNSVGNTPMLRATAEFIATAPTQPHAP